MEILRGIKDYLFTPRGRTGQILEELEETTVQIEELEKLLSEVDFEKIRRNAGWLKKVA